MINKQNDLGNLKKIEYLVILLMNTIFVWDLATLVKNLNSQTITWHVFISILWLAM